MATRRELFPLIAGEADGLSVAPAALARESAIEPALRAYGGEDLHAWMLAHTR